MKAQQKIILGSDRAAFPEMLVPPLQRKLGGGKPDIKHKGIEIHIGNRPIVRDLRTLYEKSGKTLPPELDLFVSYNLWLVTFGFGIMAGTWIREATRVGLEVRFADAPRVSVVSMMPETRFVTRIGGKLEGKVDIGVNGKASLAEGKKEKTQLEAELPFGGKVELSANANLAARLSLSVITPTIVAVGEADSRAEWVFLKESKPLVGNQTVALVLLVPRNVREIKAEARVYANIATFSFLPAKLRSEWVKLVCPI